MRKVLKLDANVFYLGVVSFLTDISSEMTLTLLPLFLTNVLGATLPIVGLIEGVAETASSLLKIVSGWLSDRSRRRKPLTLLGYGVSSLVKPLLAFANAWPLVLFVRFVDRIGKGIRTSPRDALIAESVGEGKRGRAFGWHRAADTGGAVVGLALATLVIWYTQRNQAALSRATFQQIVLWGSLAGFASVAVLIWKVHESSVADAGAAKLQPVKDVEARSSGWTLARLRRAGRRVPVDFRKYLVVMGIFTLGNSSDGFLLLRLQNVGLTVLQISIVLVIHNVLYAGFSLPTGTLSDRIGRKRLLFVGWGIYAVIYLGMAVTQGAVAAVLLFIGYGLYHAAAEGAGRAYVADLVSSEHRAEAYGLYHAVVGLAALPASLLAGFLWAQFGPPAAFFTGAALAGVAALLLGGWVPAEAGRVATVLGKE